MRYQTWDTYPNGEKARIGRWTSGEVGGGVASVQEQDQGQKEASSEVRSSTSGYLAGELVTLMA